MSENIKIQNKVQEDAPSKNEFVILSIIPLLRSYGSEEWMAKHGLTTETAQALIERVTLAELEEAQKGLSFLVEAKRKDLNNPKLGPKTRWETQHE